MSWDTVIGLEVHAQLCTKSKLFSGAKTSFGEAPNTAVSYVDAGLPGILPVLNQKAVLMAIQFGLSIHATINNFSFFERKNYFYPDLPKGYQISQFQCPIVSNGELTIALSPKQSKKITIARAHLEEDAGKSLHEEACTKIDLNRAGIPLLEIVTTPCLSSANEAILYLKALHQLLRFLKICDGNMQEGSFRVDVNISLKPKGTTKLGTRTELKNLNSFRFIEKAIDYEVRRHQDLLENGLCVAQETRLFCPTTETTQLLRSKEREQDYRYFPDPDLLPIAISKEILATAKKNMPPLPQAIQHQLEKDTDLSLEDINFLLSQPAIWEFYQAVAEKTAIEAKTIINWLRGPYLAALHESEASFENPPISAEDLSQFLLATEKEAMPHAVARRIFDKLLKGKNLIELIEAEKEMTVDEGALASLIQTLIQQYPEQKKAYCEGKEKLLAFFVGQVMKETKGQANPEQVSLLLRQYLR